MSRSHLDRDRDSDPGSSERAGDKESMLPFSVSPVSALLLRTQESAGNRAAAKMIQGSRRALTRQQTSDEPSVPTELADLYSKDVTRWVKLEPDSVALNAPNVTKMTLTHSPVIPWDKSAHDMLKENVKQDFKHVVFNCHGFISRPGFETPHLSIGTVVHPGNVDAFTQLAPLNVKVIWISACNLTLSAEGEEFCKNMARKVGSYVVAPTFAVTQNVKRDHVEDTAGAMWKYIDPKGSLVGRMDFIKAGPGLGFEYEKK
jgi:hypothetical protein